MLPIKADLWDTALEILSKLKNNQRVNLVERVCTRCGRIKTGNYNYRRCRCKPITGDRKRFNQAFLGGPKLQLGCMYKTIIEDELTVVTVIGIISYERLEFVEDDGIVTKQLVTYTDYEMVEDEYHRAKQEQKCFLLSNNPIELRQYEIDSGRKLETTDFEMIEQ